MTQKNYKMIIEYDGSRYKGWQSQKSTDATVQGKLNAVFSALEGSEVTVQGSGRTDAGVHAAGQAANVRLTVEMAAREIMEYANHYLPEDIGILKIEEVSEKFHARLSAVKKTYCYRIFNGGGSNVFRRKWMCSIEQPLDLLAMRQGAQYLVGTHDFTGFCSRAPKKKSSVRTIYRLDVLRAGDGFLHHMVRIITGTLVEIGLGKRVPLEVVKILEEGVRKEAGITMPAKGLILCEVEYEKGCGIWNNG